MRRILTMLVGIIMAAGVVFLATQVLSTTKSDKAVLKVVSTPQTTVFLDNQRLGTIPYEDFVEPGEYTLKLVPDTTIEEVVSWEGKIVLQDGLLTFVNRDLSNTELSSAGEILTLEEASGNQAELVVVSRPDGVTVTIDGQEQGVTPLALEDIAPGEHEITVSTLGSVSRTIRVKANKGFKLIAAFQLAISEDAAPSSFTPTSVDDAVSSAQERITILDTPTGFLRVRQGPTTAATESAKVNPGDDFDLLDEENGWFHIEYTEGETGWVSGQYAQRVE